MGICSWCGTDFPKTRVTRKYCTPRCKTNACLGRKPRRIRAADVERLHALLEMDLDDAHLLREHLRAILVPGSQPVVSERVTVPRLD
jgi:hypothetical protein